MNPLHLGRTARVFYNLAVHLLALTFIVCIMQGCGGGGSGSGGFSSSGVGGGGDTLTPISTATYDLTTLNGNTGFKLNGVRGSPSPGFADEFGSALSRIGDINGDGKDDILIIARRAEELSESLSANTGRAYVLFGKTTAQFAAVANGTQGYNMNLLNGTQGVTLDRLGATATQFGETAGGSGGDFNGDGLADILFGEQSYSADSNAFVLFGDSGVGDGHSFAEFHLKNMTSLGGASDLNNDGKDDGALFGGFRVSDGSAPLSVNHAGDVDGDGKDDIVVGHAGRDANGVDSGEVFLIFGATATSLDTHTTLAASGTNVISFKGNAGHKAGEHVSGIGDINHDGRDDFAIGATGASSGDGAIYVIFGRTRAQLQTLAANITTQGWVAALGNGTNGFVINNAPFATYGVLAIGSSMVALGDVNGDTIDDMALGCPSMDLVFVIYGKNSAWSNVNLDTLTQTSVGGFGIAAGGAEISAAGDVNGDGKNDLILGAVEQDRAFIVFGQSHFSDYVSVPAVFSSYSNRFLDLTNGVSTNAGGDQLLPGQYLNGIGVRLIGQTFTAFGTAVAGLGDINGDGFDDIAVSAILAQPSTSTGNPAGQVYIFYGKVFQ